MRKQTNRVYAKGTVSKESLLALTAEDFSADDDGADGESAVADALKALDGITGLGGVKSHVRALAAQIELDARRRMAGMRGSAWKSNLQPDFNVSVCDIFDASSSAVRRELDESNRFVQKSAESTSI